MDAKKPIKTNQHTKALKLSLKGLPNRHKKSGHSGHLKACQKPTKSLPKACQKPAKSLPKACQKPAKSLPKACQKPARSLQEACKKHADPN
jgi:hypothetical protein